MKQYIEREAANEACRECVRVYPNSFYNGIEAARDAIRKLPSADVRPVVLCRDCIHARHYTNKIKCGYWSEQTASKIVCEDDFCSYGEKREES